MIFLNKLIFKKKFKKFCWPKNTDYVNYVDCCKISSFKKDKKLKTGP